MKSMEKLGMVLLAAVVASLAHAYEVYAQEEEEEGGLGLTERERERAQEGEGSVLGSGVTELVLAGTVVAIAGVAGYAGYKVYQIRKKASKPKQA
jgi:hypothetical protein